MNFKANLLMFLLLILPYTLGAQPNKDKWMRNIEQTLPGLLCDSKEYFVTCFEVTQQECVDFTQMLVHGCLSNVSVALPENLDKVQGEHWGQVIGKCSYDLYEKFMQGKKRKTKDCEVTQKSKEGQSKSSKPAKQPPSQP